VSGRSFDLTILAIGVVAVSTAAVLIREADAPSIVIAASRVGLASLPLLAITAARGRLELRGDRASLLLTLLSGIFLALHFGFWIASVQQTSVITSVVLVTTTPLFVGIVSSPLLGEKPSRATWTALAIATAGALIMVSEDFDAGGDTLGGDAFALLGAIFAGGFLLIGRIVLQKTGGWLPYSTVSYTTAAVLLIGAMLIAGEGFGGHSDRTYGFLLLIALVPQLIGHTALNRSLGHLPAIVVSIAVLGEPVGATILAAVLLNEDPTLLQLVGGLVVLAGVATGVRGDVETRPALAPGVG
jgi:drug/metabolite transporter (DMT)-like permease